MRPHYNKSCDDIRVLKEKAVIDEETETDEFGNKIQKAKEIACEVGESLPGFIDPKVAESIINSPGFRPGYKNLLDGSVDGGESLKKDTSASQGLLRNETIQESIKRAGNGSSSEAQLDLTEY